ncbi:hypothetical protein [Vibrio phage CKB-S2]|nr:hypothetical protein [Vibrio phage CKB-S2]
MSKNKCDISKLRAGQTIYAVITDVTTDYYDYKVVQLRVTNEPPTPQGCDPFYKGKVSRHSMRNWSLLSGCKKPWFIRGTRGGAEKVMLDKERHEKRMAEI